jgi:hypothetical protein
MGPTLIYVCGASCPSGEEGRGGSRRLLGQECCTLVRTTREMRREWLNSRADALVGRIQCIPQWRSKAGELNARRASNTPAACSASASSKFAEQRSEGARDSEENPAILGARKHINYRHLNLLRPISKSTDDYCSDKVFMEGRLNWTSQHGFLVGQCQHKRCVRMLSCRCRRLLSCRCRACLA